MIETQEREFASDGNLWRSQASHPFVLDSIDWQIVEPILSEKDRNQPLLTEADYDFIYLDTP